MAVMMGGKGRSSGRALLSLRCQAGQGALEDLGRHLVAECLRREGRVIATVEGEADKALRQLTAFTWSVVLLGAFGSVWAGENWSVRVQHLGGVLQVAGAVAVAGEIYLLQHPGESLGAVVRRIWQRTIRWLREVLGLPRSVTVHVGSALGISVGAVGTVEGLSRSAAWNRPPPADVVEGLARLEEMVRDLDRLLSDERKQRSEGDATEAEARKAAIGDLKSEFSDAILGLERRVTSATRRPIRLRWTGVVLLIVGIVFAAWPVGIAAAGEAVVGGLGRLPSWWWGVVLALFLLVRLRRQHVRRAVP